MAQTFLPVLREAPPRPYLGGRQPLAPRRVLTWRMIVESDASAAGVGLADSLAAWLTSGVGSATSLGTAVSESSFSTASRIGPLIGPNRLVGG